MKKSYLVIQDFQSPFVQQHGVPHLPPKIGMRTIKKGQIVKGELKTDNGKPAFILCGKMTIVPLNCVREIVTKPVENKSSFDAAVYTKDTKQKKQIKIIDAALVGALVGGLGFYFAEKRGWIESESTKNRIYAAGVGALIAMYAAHRYNQKNILIVKKS